MFRVFEIATHDFDGFPATCTHDGVRVMTHGQEILGSTNPHRMAAKGIDLVALEASGCRGGLDQVFDGHREESRDDEPVAALRCQSVVELTPYALAVYLCGMNLSLVP